MAINVINVLNTILANASADFKARVPVATQTNLEDYGSAVLEYEPVTNEFIKSLINNVCYVSASNRRFTNPLSKLKSAAKPFGYMIGEVHTNPAKDKGYDISDVEDLLSVDEPDMETIYHRENRKSKYKVSISIPELQKAFTSYGEMEALILDKTNSKCYINPNCKERVSNIKSFEKELKIEFNRLVKEKLTLFNKI